MHGTVLRHWVLGRAADAQQAFPGQGQMKPEQAELARLRREVIKLNAERDIFKKNRGLLRARSAVTFAFVAKHRGIWLARWLCEALGVSRSGLCLANSSTKYPSEGQRTPAGQGASQLPHQRLDLRRAAGAAGYRRTVDERRGAEYA